MFWGESRGKERKRVIGLDWIGLDWMRFGMILLLLDGHCCVLRASLRAGFVFEPAHVPYLTTSD